MRNTAPSAVPADRPLYALRRDRHGDFAALGVESIATCGGRLFIAGWRIGCDLPKFVLSDRAGSADCVPVARVSDRSEALTINGTTAVGFLMVVELAGQTTEQGLLTASGIGNELEPQLPLDLGSVGATPLSELVAKVLTHHPDLAAQIFRTPTQFQARCDELHSQAIGEVSEAPEGKGEIVEFGVQPERPRCSIIIVLSHTQPFLAGQLLEFASDSAFSKDTDLIFVMRDPQRAALTTTKLRALQAANDIPFRLLIPNAPCRPAHACNAAARIARAPLILLLSESVIPTATGWLDAMLDALDGSDKTGAVGVTLNSYDDTPRLSGIDIIWSHHGDADRNGAYAKRGADAMRPGGVRGRAMSLACLLTTKSNYAAVGGLDEGYIGDNYSAADFCLKLRDRSLELVLCRASGLVDLAPPSPRGAEHSRGDIGPEVDASRLLRTWQSVLVSPVECAGSSGR